MSIYGTAPGHLLNAATTAAVVTLPRPFRPGFLEPSGFGMAMHEKEFSPSAFSFFDQNAETNDDPNAIICGNKVYSRRDLVHEWDDPDPRTTGGHAEAGTVSRWDERSIAFDSNDDPFLQFTSGGVDEDGNVDPSPLPNVTPPSTGLTQDGGVQTVEVVHGASESWEHTRTDTYTETLSLEVTSGVVEGWLSEWLGRTTGGDGIGSAIRDIASRSESTGRDYRIRGSHYWVFHPLFPSSSSSGTTGDLGAEFNGSFSTTLRVVTRKNKPVLKGATYLDASGDLQSTPNQGSGISLYGVVSRTATLSEECTGIWADQYGTYDWNPDGSYDPVKAEAALEAAPFETETDALSQLQPFGFNTIPHQPLFVSRTGRQYRITLHGFYYSENGPPDQTLVFITDPETMQWSEPLHKDYPPETQEFGVWFVVAKIEVNAAPPDEAADWQILAERHETSVDPVDLLTTDRCAPLSSPIFWAFKARTGSPFGWSGFHDPETRFKVQTRSVSYVTPQPGSTPSETCGDPYPQGTIEYQEVMTWDESGLSTTPTVHTRIIGGVDWSPEILGEGDGGEVPYPAGNDTDTNTARTDTFPAPAASDGVYHLAFDESDPSGKITAETFHLLPFSVSGGQNISASLSSSLPSAGHTTYMDSHRLRY